MSKKLIHTAKAPAAIGPYSQGYVINDKTLYTSGQIPVVAETGEVPATVAEQTGVCLANVKFIVEEAGFEVKDIFKTLVFVKDLGQFAEFNAAYEAFFKANGVTDFPARSCVEVARLPKDVLVEIEVIATK